MASFPMDNPQLIYLCRRENGFLAQKVKVLCPDLSAKIAEYPGFETI